MVIRSPYGGGVRTPELHSDSLVALFSHIPGLKIVMPSNPYDAKELLILAIRDNDPVLFLEPMKLYRTCKQDVCKELSTRQLLILERTNFFPSVSFKKKTFMPHF